MTITEIRVRCPVHGCAFRPPYSPAKWQAKAVYRAHRTLKHAHATKLRRAWAHFVLWILL